MNKCSAGGQHERTVFAKERGTQFAGCPFLKFGPFWCGETVSLDVCAKCGCVYRGAPNDTEDADSSSKSPAGE